MSPAAPARPAPQASLNLGVIGNCAYNALIDREGGIVWCCLPRFDGDPVFNRLLDASERGSEWRIELEGLAEATQEYVPNTAVLRTTLTDAQGQRIEITDFAPRYFVRGRTFRPLTLVRRVRVLAGTPRIRVVLTPRYDWGRALPMVTRGSNHIRFIGPDQSLRLTTDAPISYLQAQTWFVADRGFDFVLGPDETLSESVREVAERFENETLHYWRLWVRSLSLPLEWQDAVIRAAITLKMSLYEDTGAIIAAMTTSIPESADSGRNWDYRYCWLRDSFFVVRALNSLSEVATMEEYLRWLFNALADAKGGHVQPLYGLGLERDLVEQQLLHLPGYRGMGPVRVGNQAYEHFQHDVYGNIVLGAAQAFHDHRLLSRPSDTQFRHLEACGELALKVWNTPDAGMWELRTRARIHTSSALMSWAACDRLGKIALSLGKAPRAEYWAGHAQEIRSAILEKAWNEERQAYAESFGGRDLDASVLLMAEVGMVDPSDPRFVSTVDVLDRHLCDGPFMRRYEAPDDFGAPEVAFNICTFWRIEALARIGRTQEARALFESMLAARNHVGLLAEDTHPKTGELWGNYPQTYSMVGIINCATRLSRPWHDVI